MTQGKCTISVDKKITEQVLLENCFNLHHSGYDYRIMLFFYALAKGMKANKLLYYIDLIEEKKGVKEK